jgi:hypothetical protein
MKNNNKKARLAKVASRYFGHGVWASLVLAAGLASCARVDIIPPDSQLPPPAVRIIQDDAPRVWSRMMGWFDAHEVEISEINEAQGVIIGSLALAEDDTQVDCGRFTIKSSLTPPVLKKRARVRAHFSKGFGGSLQVLISVTGTYRLDVMNTYAAQMITHTGPCVSRGGLEKQIFAFLQGTAS